MLSCPPSPNLLPMIGRRTSHSDHLPQARTNFNYLPTSGLMPQSFRKAGQFEPTLQVSTLHPTTRATLMHSAQENDFFQGMFDMPMRQDRAAARALQPLSMVHDQLGSPPPPLLPRDPPGPPRRSPSPRSSPTPSRSPAPPTHPCGRTTSNSNRCRRTWTCSSSTTSTCVEHASLWPSGSTDSVFLGDDFDLNVIPAIKLRLPKFSEDQDLSGLVAATAPVYGVLEHERFDNALFGSNDMMARTAGRGAGQPLAF